MIEAIITILGLCVFEVICSIDNAVVNANVLKTIGKKQRNSFHMGSFYCCFSC